ncbi:hypothetical protein ACP5PY_23165 [Photobacterium leiognathi subsp. mandapamensis]
MLVDNKLATAYYDVGFELPESFAISLNKYAIPAGLFKKKAEKTPNKLKEKQLADIQSSLMEELILMSTSTISCCV